MADTETKIGQLLDTLGVLASLDPEDMVSDALVLMKVVGKDGRVSIGIATSEGMDWITRLGLLNGYDRLENHKWFKGDSSDDD